MNHSGEDPKDGSVIRDEEDKLQGGEIRVRNRFTDALANFWYHYKWYVIVIVFFAITFAVCFAQCASNEQSDVSVLFAGPVVLSSEDKNAVLAALEDALPKDFNENGKKNVALFSFVSFTETELQDTYNRTISEHPDEDVTVAATAYINQLRTASNSDRSNYTTAVGAGECAVLLISESLYENLRDNGRLEPLSSVLNTSQVPLLDEYAVRLTDTAFYRNYEAAKTLPAGTVLCLLKQPILGTMHNDTEYANAKEMFRALVGN